jgi:hypothetical protein
MKAVKVLAIVMLAVFSYSGVSAKNRHKVNFKHHWHRLHRKLSKVN